MADRLLDFVEARYGLGELGLISDWMIERIGDKGGFRVLEDQSNADYLYSASLLASLRVKRFKGKAAKADAFESAWGRQPPSTFETRSVGKRDRGLLFALV